MSKSDLDSEQSYCSDDSEFNYISGLYMIEAVEVEEANWNEAALPTDDNLDPDTFIPYEDDWLPINTKLKTKPSTARLDRKTGKLLSVSLSLLKSIESLILLLCNQPLIDGL